MEKKQGCVDWLVEEINKQKVWADPSKLEPIIQQAKEMENSQKKEMYVKGLKNYDPTYLNEIYGGNNSEVTISNNKHECCTPKGQVPRYVDCVGCDKKPIEGATLSYAEAQKDSFSIMEKKQSSVEWLEWQINLGLSERGLISAFKEAKAMHKEQIIDAIFFGMQKGLNVNKVPETDNDWVNNYYNETFGGEK